MKFVDSFQKINQTSPLHEEIRNANKFRENYIVKYEYPTDPNEVIIGWKLVYVN
jgi:hypothetical protein